MPYKNPIKLQVKKAGLLTVSEVSKKYGLYLTFIHRLIKDSKLKVTVFGSMYGISEKDIENLIKTGGQK